MKKPLPTAEHLRRVLSSGVLTECLTELPPRGATEAEMAEIDALVGRTLSEQHRSLLRVWNGANLDVVQFFATSGDNSMRSYSRLQFPGVPGPAVPFAADPAGFVYLEAPDGQVWAWDHDGGGTEPVARDIHDFFCAYVFGPRAAEFGGVEWHDQLSSAGLVNERDA